jgi:hypothetical protein
VSHQHKSLIPLSTILYFVRSSILFVVISYRYYCNDWKAFNIYLCLFFQTRPQSVTILGVTRDFWSGLVETWYILYIMSSKKIDGVKISPNCSSSHTLRTY